MRWTIGLAILAYCAGPAMAQSSIQTAFNYNLDEAAAPAAPAEDSADAATGGCADGCGCADEAGCGCEPGCGCDNGCCSCDACGCGGGGFGSCLGDCCLGEAWTLSSCLTPCCTDGPTYGGWASMGYYNKNERLSTVPGDEKSFLDWPDHLNLDQLWFYTEKLATTDSCCATYGYRFDMMYGAEGHAAQSFGNDGGTWDVTWDHGPYEWAIPQLYGEVGWNDWSIKIGHFFTPAGYEVINDTGNFFYSHTLTHYNSEPFTHTGVLGTYSGMDKVTLYTGWALGWDTGFDQFGGGNIFVGGAGLELTDNFTFTYITTAGNFGWRSGNQDGWSQHIVGVLTLSENWKYVIQSDYITTNGVLADPTFHNEDKGVTNYLFYTLNDCWSVGGRVEWWKSNNVAVGDAVSFYDITGGFNYKPHANVVIRPEIRYDWTPAAETVNQAVGTNYNQSWFGIDAIFTF